MYKVKKGSTICNVFLLTPHYSFYKEIQKPIDLTHINKYMNNNIFLETHRLRILVYTRIYTNGEFTEKFFELNSPPRTERLKYYRAIY